MECKIKMQFDPEIAKEIGVDEAIMLSNIDFWCEHNKANDRHLHDNSYWTYNSRKAFSKLFPFWSPDQIKRILRNLEKKGHIKTANYNKMQYDKTKWYTTLGQNHPTEESKPPNRRSKNTQPIPDNKPNNKPDSLIEQKKSARVRKLMDVFYQSINPTISWGNKTTRKACQDLIDRFGENEAMRMATMICEAQQKGDQFCPTATTPYQMREKLAQFKIYFKKKKNSRKKVGFVS